MRSPLMGLNVQKGTIMNRTANIVVKLAIVALGASSVTGLGAVFQGAAAQTVNSGPITGPHDPEGGDGGTPAGHSRFEGGGFHPKIPNPGNLAAQSPTNPVRNTYRQLEYNEFLSWPVLCTRSTDPMGCMTQFVPALLGPSQTG